MLTQSNTFQASDRDGEMLPHIKREDTRVLCNLIYPIIAAKIARKSFSLTMTDAGCGEGLMITALLEKLEQLLEENLINYLSLRIVIYAFDKELDYRNRYRSLFEAQPKRRCFENVTVQFESDEQRNKTENFQTQCDPAKKSDVILCSHSMYYTGPQKFWDLNSHNIEFEENLLTRFLHSLKDTGIIAVIMNSEQSSGEKNCHDHDAPSLYQWEKVMYPTIGATRESCKTAEEFQWCLETYKTQYLKKTGQVLSAKDEKSLIFFEIELGDINFDIPDPTTGKYIQKENKALTFLNFYTRNQYNILEPEKQKRLLDFLKNNCVRSGDKLIMCHINRIFIIGPKATIDFISDNKAEQKSEHRLSC